MGLRQVPGAASDDRRVERGVKFAFREHLRPILRNRRLLIWYNMGNTALHQHPFPPMYAPRAPTDRAFPTLLGYGMEIPVCAFAPTS